MTLLRDSEPLVTALRQPPAAPRIPIQRRLARLLFRAWPFAVWCGALVAAGWLYVNAVEGGHAIARAELEELRISASTSGRIETLAVRIGQRVEAGELIATLDPRDVDSRIRVAQAELERARALVQAKRAELRLSGLDRGTETQAQRNSYENEGRRLRSEIEAHQAVLATDQAERGVLLPQLERLAPLVEQRLVTVDRAEQMRRQEAILAERITTRSAELDAARLELGKWEAEAPNALADQDLDVALSPFETELGAGVVRVEELERERKNYLVYSPCAGVVSLIAALPGEWRVTGEEIVHVVVPRPDRATGFVMDRQVSAVSVGTHAVLLPRSSARPALQGRVVTVGPRLELIPPELREIATVEQWGRRVVFDVVGGGDLLPGEFFAVRFQ